MKKLQQSIPPVFVSKPIYQLEAYLNSWSMFPNLAKKLQFKTVYIHIALTVVSNTLSPTIMEVENLP